MRTHTFIEIHGESALLVERKIVKSVPASALVAAFHDGEIASPLMPINTIRWRQTEHGGVFYILRPMGRQHVAFSAESVDATVLTPWNLFIVSTSGRTVKDVRHFWLLKAPSDLSEPLYEPCFPSRFTDGHLCLDGTHLLEDAPMVQTIDALLDQIMTSLVNRELMSDAWTRVPTQFKTGLTGGISVVYREAILRWQAWSDAVPHNPVDEQAAIQTVQWTRAMKREGRLKLEEV